MRSSRSARIPTGDWADYLDWFPWWVGVDVRRGGASARSIQSVGDDLIALHLGESESSSQPERWVETALKLILATGVWERVDRSSRAVADLSPAVFAHTADAIDFAALAGKSVAVLGAAASAFDAAATALEAGRRVSADITPGVPGW